MSTHRVVQINAIQLCVRFMFIKNKKKNSLRNYLLSRVQFIGFPKVDTCSLIVHYIFLLKHQEKTLMFLIIIS